MPVRRLFLVVLLAIAFAPPALSAQQPASALQLENAGRLDQAAQAYRDALEQTPARISDLYGLERVLRRLDRLDELRPYLARAVQADPRNETIRELQFRVATALDGADTVAVVAAQWMLVLPSSVAPYRAWAQWLAQRGDLDGARALIAAGQERLGGPRLAEYAAQFAALDGDWEQAGSHWTEAVSVNPTLIGAAAGSLRRAPDAVRQDMLDALMAQRADAGSWIAAFLLAWWDRPEEGWTLLDGSLPAGDVPAGTLLRRFADAAGEWGAPDGLRARGLALERLAERSIGDVAERARLEAARAYADAGSLSGAQRMLNRLAVTADPNSREAAAAMGSFIEILADAGQVAEAEARFDEWESRLSDRDVSPIKEKLAWGWMRRGDLGRAETLLEGDSSVGAQAVLGWASLYRGDLANARERLQSAGPYAQSRAEGTRRSTVLVLLERVRAERSPELGAALLAVARGDTVGGVAELRAAASRFPPTAGRAEVLLLAGEVAAAGGDSATAEALFVQALSADPEGPSAPTVELALASLLASSGRVDEALHRLEHLILTYPQSAVVPQARRLLDRVRGAIPST